MARINTILEDFIIKLNKEADLLASFTKKMDDFLLFFAIEDKTLGKILDNFTERLENFNKRLANFVKEGMIIKNYLKKTAKKPSASLRDVASLTERIEKLTKRGEILNAEAEILLDESKTIKEKYLAFAK